MAERELRDALDKCLTLLTEERVTLEGCLARYPEQAAELRPLLEMAMAVRQVAPPEPSPVAVAAGRERMLQAVAARERQRERREARAAASLVGLWARVEALLGDLRRALAERPALAPGWAAAAAVLLLLLVGGLFLRSWTRQTIPQLAMATLEVRGGIVEVQSGRGEGWTPAWSGQQVDPGTRIRTGGDGAVLVTFFDGSMTAMNGDTEIAIERLRPPKEEAGRVIVLSQKRGRTQHRVETANAPESRFEVRSPLAVTVVRGTTFGVEVQDDGTTEVAVQEGVVEVRAQREIIQLEPGWATSVEPKRPPATPFEAPTPMMLDVFPTRPAAEAVGTATASPTLVPTEPPSPTWTPKPLPTDTPLPAEEEPTEVASPKPKGTPVKATDTPVAPTAVVTATATPLPTTAIPTQEGPPTERPETPVPTRTPTPMPTDTPDEIPPTKRPETPVPTPTPVPTATPEEGGGPPSDRPENPGGGGAVDGQAESTPTAPGEAGPENADRLAARAASSPGVGKSSEGYELQPVGGVTLPRSALGLLAPWIGLLGLLGLLAAGALLRVFGAVGS
jgi:hypothetical protein